MFNNTCSLSKELHTVSNYAMGTRPAEPGVSETTLSHWQTLCDDITRFTQAYKQVARLESRDGHCTLVCIAWKSQWSAAVHSALGQN